MKFFKPEDFRYLAFVALEHQEIVAISLANISNAKLEREGKVVYGGESDKWTIKKYAFDTSAALLINIEQIEVRKPTYEELEEELFVLKTKNEMDKCMKNVYQKLHCTHPSPQVDQDDFELYKCYCGAKLKPKTFEVVDETNL